MSALPGLYSVAASSHLNGKLKKKIKKKLSVLILCTRSSGSQCPELPYFYRNIEFFSQTSPCSWSWTTFFPIPWLSITETPLSDTHIHLHMHNSLTHSCTHFHTCSYSHTFIHTHTHPYPHKHSNSHTNSHLHILTYSHICSQTHSNTHTETHTQHTSCQGSVLLLSRICFFLPIPMAPLDSIPHLDY